MYLHYIDVLDWNVKALQWNVVTLKSVMCWIVKSLQGHFLSPQVSTGSNIWTPQASTQLWPCFSAKKNWFYYLRHLWRASVGAESLHRSRKKNLKPTRRGRYSPSLEFWAQSFPMDEKDIPKCSHNNTLKVILNMRMQNRESKLCNLILKSD